MTHVTSLALALAGGRVEEKIEEAYRAKGPWRVTEEEGRAVLERSLYILDIVDLSNGKGFG